jgi:thymidine kinase
MAPPLPVAVHVLSGPMYSEKSTTLAAMHGRHTRAGRRVLLLVPSTDTRYDSEGASLATHTGARISATPLDPLVPMIQHARALENALFECDIVLIDEAQFFLGLYDFCFHVTNVCKKPVIAAGLLMDANAKAFGELWRVLLSAEHHTHLSAVCACSADANFSALRLGATGGVGAEEKYIAQCRACYYSTS